MKRVEFEVRGRYSVLLDEDALAIMEELEFPMERMLQQLMCEVEYDGMAIEPLGQPEILGYRLIDAGGTVE